MLWEHEVVSSSLVAPTYRIMRYYFRLIGLLLFPTLTYANYEHGNNGISINLETALGINGLQHIPAGNKTTGNFSANNGFNFGGDVGYSYGFNEFIYAGLGCGFLMISSKVHNGENEDSDKYCAMNVGCTLFKIPVGCTLYTTDLATFWRLFIDANVYPCFTIRDSISRLDRNSQLDAYKIGDKSGDNFGWGILIGGGACIELNEMCNLLLKIGCDLPFKGLCVLTDKDPKNSELQDANFSSLSLLFSVGLRIDV